MRRTRRRVSIIGVLGELFITAGVLVLLFLGWQVWINDRVVGNEQKQEAQALSNSWDKGEAVPPATVDRADPGEPVVAAAPANAVVFATLIIPRLGADYTRPVAEGVGLVDVLNKHSVGHYPGTQMPGAVGNAAFAAHRTGWGASFFDIDKLQLGDSIYVETPDGWYRYVFRSFEYVRASGVGVLAPVPQAPGATSTDRILTLTSCNPVYTADERIIAYSVYDTWYPRAGGAPPEIASSPAMAGAAG
ncbi:MAG: class sortase [Rhodoglobus sp.]|nr:class sortase [Rhodoglobus sp.]